MASWIKEDECPTDSGLVEFKGCPDTDGDGIKDLDDKCPLKPGQLNLKVVLTRMAMVFQITRIAVRRRKVQWTITVALMVTRTVTVFLTRMIKCIDIPGPAENKGCPYADLDGDGVLDKDDSCIDTPGPAENKRLPIQRLRWRWSIRQRR